METTVALQNMVEAAVEDVQVQEHKGMVARVCLVLREEEAVVQVVLRLRLVELVAE